MDSALNTTADYRGPSLWHATVDDDLTPRCSLDGDLDTDVAIEGAGLNGLWTAYELQRRNPSLRITLLEKEIAGFGASGRNGGWCSALLPASTGALAKQHGLDAALAMKRAMIDTVRIVGETAHEAGIDCDWQQGGTIVFARNEPQWRAAQAEVATARS